MQNMNANFLGGMSITLLRAWLLTMAVALPAQAVDFTLSGFGTAGYAQSDNAANYQRFITITVLSSATAFLAPNWMRGFPRSGALPFKPKSLRLIIQIVITRPQWLGLLYRGGLRMTG